MLRQAPVQQYHDGYDHREIMIAHDRDIRFIEAITDADGAYKVGNCSRTLGYEPSGGQPTGQSIGEHGGPVPPDCFAASQYYCAGSQITCVYSVCRQADSVAEA